MTAKILQFPKKPAIKTQIFIHTLDCDCQLFDVRVILDLKDGNRTVRILRTQAAVEKDRKAMLISMAELFKAAAELDESEYE